MKKNNVTCERCGKHQSVNNVVHLSIHTPPYTYYGFNICHNCYNKFKEFMDELGRTELWTDSYSCSTCKYCDKLATDEPCMDCDPRYRGSKNHWEAKDEKCEWIPVSNKLPDVPQRYLVYTKENDIITDLFMENGKFMLGDDIIAWQQLPEPYRKGGAE